MHQFPILTLDEGATRSTPTRAAGSSLKHGFQNSKSPTPDAVSNGLKRKVDATALLFTLASVCTRPRSASPASVSLLTTLGDEVQRSHARREPVTACDVDAGPALQRAYSVLFLFPLANLVVLIVMRTGGKDAKNDNPEPLFSPSLPV